MYVHLYCLCLFIYTVHVFIHVTTSCINFTDIHSTEDICQDLGGGSKRTYSGGRPPNTPPYSQWGALIYAGTSGDSRRGQPFQGLPTFPSIGLAFYQPMVAYLVARHRDVPVLHFPLHPDTDAQMLQNLFHF